MRRMIIFRIICLLHIAYVSVEFTVNKTVLKYFFYLQYCNIQNFSARSWRIADLYIIQVRFIVWRVKMNERAKGLIYT